jgi:hypothetical protein
VIVHIPDDPHITVKVRSRRFKDIETTYHILTKVSKDMVRGLKVSNPRNREDIRAHPGGFPYEVLEAKGLSEQSKRMTTPDREYTRLYNKWVATDLKKANQKAEARGEYLVVGGNLSRPSGKVPIYLLPTCLPTLPSPFSLVNK